MTPVSKQLLTQKLYNKKLMKESYFNMKREKLWVKTFHLIDLVKNHSKLSKEMKKYNFLMMKINLIAIRISHIQTLKYLKVILLLNVKNQSKSLENHYPSS